MANENIMPYPYMFDPSQFSNKYSQFNTGAQLPGWPTQYAGTPTDAMGRPIQSYLDAQTQNAAMLAAPSMPPATTLNSNPSAGGLTPWQQYQQQVAMNPGVGEAAAANVPASDAASLRSSSNIPQNMGPSILQSVLQHGGTPSGQQWIAGMGLGQQNKPAAAAPTGPQGLDMSAAYLAALSNPGKVITPGATVAQAPPPSSQSGVLDQFLANWKAGGSQTQGAGNYNNAPFFKALQGQV